jgi:hypothetical protein
MFLELSFLLGDEGGMKTVLSPIIELYLLMYSVLGLFDEGSNHIIPVKFYAPVLIFDRGSNETIIPANLYEPVLIFDKGLNQIITPGKFYVPVLSCVYPTAHPSRISVHSTCIFLYFD